MGRAVPPRDLPRPRPRTHFRPVLTQPLHRVLRADRGQDPGLKQGSDAPGGHRGDEGPAGSILRAVQSVILSAGEEGFWVDGVKNMVLWPGEYGLCISGLFNSWQERMVK